MSSMGLGIYHSGVEVYGIEYAYGGHPFPFSGIFQNTPRDAEELGENFRFKFLLYFSSVIYFKTYSFRESILIGYTDFAEDDVPRLVQAMGREFSGDKYHLMSRNCNHFTAAFSQV